MVSDPHHLPRWWPSVQRVEEASEAGWTKVLRTDKGKAVRADFTRVEADEPRRLVWRQEVEESPFERILAESVTELTLEPAGESGTRVRLRMRQKLRGMYRFGSLNVRTAASRQIEEALEGLERAFG